MAAEESTELNIEGMTCASCVARVEKVLSRVPGVLAATEGRPSLLEAQGSAMATGTDVATSAAGVTLMRGDPNLAADAIEISGPTSRKIRQNLFWAAVYNAAGLPLAALGLLNPVFAGAAMALSSISVSVVVNALSLKRWRGAASTTTRP